MRLSSGLIVSKAGQHGYSVITKTQDEMEKMEKSKPNRGVKLGDYAEKIRQRLKDNYQYRTADINQCTMKSFMKFRKQKDILLCELDELVVGAYESYLKHQGLTLNTISFYMRRLRAIYNSAVKELEIPDRKPFAGAFTRTTKTSKRAISQKAIRQLAQLKLETYNQQLPEIYSCSATIPEACRSWISPVWRSRISATDTLSIKEGRRGRN